MGLLLILLMVSQSDAYLQLRVVDSTMPIKSIELQLIRVETCGCAEGYARDGTLSVHYVSITCTFGYLHRFV